MKKSYHLLKDDLDDLIKDFPENENIPEQVRHKYRRRGKKAGITHPSLGCNGKNNPNPLVLEWDQNYVGSRSGACTRNYWDYNDNHAFPPMIDMVRFSLFMCLDVYRLSHLVLKSEWERYWGYEFNGWRPHGRGNSRNLIDYFQDVDEMRKHLKGFDPDAEALFDMIEGHGNVVSDAGYNKENFQSLVTEMIFRELHFGSVKSGKLDKSTELDAFIVEETNRLRLSREGTADQREEYWKERNEWLELQVKLETTFISIENQCLKNAEIERRYLAVFGKEELRIRELEDEINLLNRRLLLKQTDPELTAEELDETLSELAEKIRREHDDLQFRVMIAPFLEKDVAGAIPATAELMSQQEKERKRLIRKIATLTHPDRLEHNPAFKKLTEKQKEELKRILIEATKKITAEELGYPQGFLESQMRTPEGLARVLQKVEMILENAGIDVRVEFEIQGDTMPDQLVWLKKEIGFLKSQIILFKNELATLNELDTETQRRKGILEIPEKHDAFRRDMEIKIEELAAEADRLRAELELFFEKENES